MPQEKIEANPRREEPGTLRIEVTGPRGDRAPQPPTTDPGPAADSGRGLLLAEALSTRWGCDPRLPSGKTMWACLPLS
jgi:hypothetical protein